MLAYPVLSYKERLWLVLAAPLIGLVLGAGFLGAANSIFSALPLGAFRQTAPFVGLALFFHFSLPSTKAIPDRSTWAPFPWKSAPIAFLIAAVFGACLGRPGAQAQTLTALSWMLFFIPVGEELLFRGWLWKLSLRIFGTRLFTFSNPLPAAVVATSLSFSFWHLQNLQYFPVALTLLQVGYAFFVSIWLCALRCERGGIFTAITAHAGLNAATYLGQLLSLL